jgi:hypothetical protein
MRAQKVFYPILIAVISLAVYQVIRLLYALHWEELTNIALGVVARTPDWIAYQNRILAPYLIYFISTLGISYTSALKIFILFAVLFQNFLWYVLLKKANISAEKILTIILVYSFIFLCIQEYNLYTWDYLDIAMATLLAWGIFQQKSIPYFIVLFFIFIFNRESALFIGVYLILDGFDFSNVDNFKWRISLKSKGKLFTGTLLVILGVMMVVVLRKMLFIIQASGFTDSKHELVGNHFRLFANLADLFIHNFSSFQFMNSLFLLGSTGYALSFVARSNDAQLKAIIIFLLMVVSILAFGAVNETRLYSILLPFLIFFYSPISSQNTSINHPA